VDVHLRLLRYFVAVAEHRSFTGASRRLHVSQPALSRQVRQLETELGVTLFERTPRGVLLTAAGDALAEEAGRLLESWSRAQAAMHAAHRAQKAVLRVGFTAATTNDLLGPVLAAFGRDRPGWRVAMTQMSWQDPTALLRSGEVDVGFVRHPVPDLDVLAHLVVRTEPRILALPAGHPLAARDTVRFDDLLDETFVPLPPGPWRDYWLCTELRGGRPPRTTEPVSGPEEWSAAISMGRGLAVTAASTADHYARPGIAFRPLPELSPSTVSVAWRRDDRQPQVRDFVRACGTIPPTPPPTPPTAPQAEPGQPVRPDARLRARAAPPAPDVLRIAVSSQPDPLRQRLLDAFTHARPATPVALTPTDSTRSRVEAVLAGDVDVAFARLGTAPDAALDHLRLSTAPMLLAVSGAHPLAHRSGDDGGALPIGVLHGEPLAFYHREQNPWWHDDVLGMLRTHLATPRIVYRGLWVYDVVPVVAAGTALALVGAPSAGEVTLPGVTYRRLDPAPSVHVGLLWRRGTANASLRRFLALARTTAESAMMRPSPRLDRSDLGTHPAEHPATKEEQ
jgi:DNA-binding transcriptional LysR family regulator